MAGGNAEDMTDNATTRNPTDEPDGTPAHAASLRPPGQSLGGGPDDGVDFGADDDRDATDAEVRRAGYDADAVSGDTAAVRPE